MHLDALVVAIGGATRVGDDGLLAGRGFEDDADGVEIAGIADLLVDQHRGMGADGNRFLAEQEARHVEVVDGHVAKNAAGAGDVVERRRTRIARRYGDHLDIADGAVVDRLADRGEMRIEAAVEADHQHSIGLLDHGQAFFDALDVEIDRLLAEDRLAGPGETLDEIGVGVGRRADDDGVDVLGLLDGIDRAHFGAIGGSQFRRRLFEGIGHGHEFGLRVGTNGAGMHLADAAGAEKSEAESHGMSFEGGFKGLSAPPGADDLVGPVVTPVRQPGARPVRSWRR